MRLRASTVPFRLPPCCQVDDREGRCHERVARDDDIRLAEEHDRVAVGVRRRLVQHLHGLAVEVQLLLRGEERVRRPRGERDLGLTLRWRAHPFHHVLVRPDERGIGRRPGLARDVAAGHRLPCRGHLDVPAGVIAVHVRVDDVADRFVAGDLANLGDELVGQRLDQRVNDEDAVLTHGERGVREPSDRKVDVALHGPHPHLDVGEVRLTLGLPREPGRARQGGGRDQRREREARGRPRPSRGHCVLLPA